MFRATWVIIICNLLLAACGANPTDRALTGAALGGPVGGLVGSGTPLGIVPGALLGGAGGAAAGALTDPSQIDLGEPIWRSAEEHQAALAAINPDLSSTELAELTQRDDSLSAALRLKMQSDSSQPTPPPVTQATTVKAASGISGATDMAVMQAERRVALVIGNGTYKTAPLVNPPNDARGMAAALREVGFEVIEKIDVDYSEMLRAVVEFGMALEGEGVGVFYYAGHAIQVGGKNYMIPIDASIEREEYVPVETLDIDQVLARMAGAHNRLNIVVLDACRDNPYARSFRGAARGLAQAHAPSGTFLAYATAPGDVAADGAGGNSPYTEAILATLEVPGLELDEVFKRVRVQVRERTGAQQTPWISSSVIGNFYFRLPEEPAAPLLASATARVGQTREDIAVWNAIKDSTDPNDFRTFLDLYPNGPFAPFARNRLKAVEKR